MFVWARPAEKQAEEKQVSKRVNTGSGSTPGMGSDILSNLLNCTWIENMKIMQHSWAYWQWKLTCIAEGGSSRLVEKDLQTLTVTKLKTMLKEKGLPLKGIKVHLHLMGPAGQIWFYLEAISVPVVPNLECNDALKSLQSTPLEGFEYFQNLVFFIAPTSSKIYGLLNIL